MTIRIRPEVSWIPPAEAAKAPFIFDCNTDDGCYFMVCTRTVDEAFRLHITHRCPRKGPNMDQENSPSLLERAWAQLDEEVNAIFARLATGFDPATEKARARGKAEILALLMAPVFATADEISAEAAARYGARQSGAAHRTPGLDPRYSDADARAAVARRTS